MLRKILLTCAILCAPIVAHAQPVDARNPVFPMAGIVVNPNGLPGCNNLGPGTINVCSQSGVGGTIAINGTPLSGGASIPTASLLGGTGTAFSSVTLGTNLSITDGTLNATGGSSLPTSAPLVGSDSGGAGLTVTPSNGLTISGSNLIPTYGTSAGTFAQGNDSRIVGALQSVPIATTSILGGVIPDGTTISINGSGVISSIGGAATSVVVGTTTVGGGSAGSFLQNNSGTLGNVAPTGSGSVVLSTSPTLVTPALGTPSAIVLTNGTGLPIAGMTGLGTGVASALGSAVTGSGGLVGATSPTLVTPTITGAPTISNVVYAYGALYSSTGSTGAPTAGGTGYTVGDVMTASAGTCSVAPTVVALSVSGGVITRFQVQNQGVCTVPPAQPVAVTGGTGTGATFPLVFGALVANIPADTSIPSGVFVGNAFIATGVTPLINSVQAVEELGVGWHACAGLIGGGETTCVGSLSGGNGDSSFSTYFGGAGAALLATGTGGAITATESGGSVTLSIATPGTGYAAGTFSLTFAGGGCSVKPVGTWTVSGGIISSTSLTGAGTGCSSNPTVALWPQVPTTQDNDISGTDALRHAGWATMVTAHGTSACKYCGFNFVTGLSGQANYITAIGTNAELLNADYVSSENDGIGLGNNSCRGAGGATTPTAYWVNVVCLGSKTGGALTQGATNDLFVGNYTGNALAATLTGTILIGVNPQPGGNGCDTNTSNYFGLCGIAGPWFSATGTNVPATSVATIAGGLIVGAPTGSAPGTGIINAQGFEVNGVSLNGGYSGVYGLSDSTTVATGGTGYVAGDVLTLTDGCTTSGKITVTAVSGGVIPSTGFTVTTRGSCATPPNNPVSVTGGTGTGATFTGSYNANGNLIFPPYNVNANFLLTGQINAAFAGVGTVLAGPGAGFGMIGASNNSTAYGNGACGGNGTSLVAFQDDCHGYHAGYLLSGTTTLVDAYGANALLAQSNATTQIAVFGGQAALNENYAGGANANIAVFGTQECKGASGTAAYHIGFCFGTLDGSALTTAQEFILLGQNAGNATFASGSDVILVSTGLAAIDTPAAGTTHWINLNNTLIENMTKPTVSSGFGTTPSVAGTSSLAFAVNVGTGGSATSGVVAFATAAPTAWACAANDDTTGSNYQRVVATSTTTVTVTNYSATTGTATPWAANDILEFQCFAR